MKIELNERTFTAIGRFVVSFSGVIQALEQSTIFLMNPPAPGSRPIRNLLEAALAGRTAEPATKTFFSVFYEAWGVAITDEDKKILKALRKEINDITEIRNRLLHDIWLNGYTGNDKIPSSMGRHRVRVHGEGVEHERIKIQPEDIEELAEKAKKISQYIWRICWFGPHLIFEVNTPNLKTSFDIENKVLKMKSTEDSLKEYDAIKNT